jgi:hypothetical protein
MDFCGVGVRLSPLGTSDTNWSMYQPLKIDEYGAFGGIKIGRGNRTRRKPTPVPLSSPQIPHGLSGDGTLIAALGSRRLIAWAMARPALGWCSTEKGQMVNICSEAPWFYKVAGISWPTECLSSLWTVETDSDNTLGGSHSHLEQTAFVSAMLSGSLEFAPIDASDL